MACKLFDHAQAEDRLLASVMKNVKADQPGIEISVFDHPIRLKPAR
jgi:hypothetical protein